MPITSIISQPLANELKSAYRPIIVICEATQTSPTGANDYVPPAVYCDVYVNDVYYKSLAKIQPINKPVYNTTPARFEFDIQDACQEVLSATIPDNGRIIIQPIDTAAKKIKCKLRASSINAEGFTVVEGTVPVQGTGNNDPVSGEGEVTNEFVVVNAVLQHEDNQNLAIHLSTFKKRTWQNEAFPLTHRLDNYKLYSNDSDVFPIIYLGDKELKCIRIKYKLKGQTEFSTAMFCIDDEIDPPVCVPVSHEEIVLPNATVGVAYSYSTALTGTTPYNLIITSKPAWMTIAIVGSSLNITGTPSEGDITEADVVAFVIENECGDIETDTTIIVEDEEEPPTPIYMQLDQYYIGSEGDGITGVCTLGFNWDRSSAAQAQAVIDNVTIKCTVYILMDNGCSTSVDVIFLPADTTVAVHGVNLDCGNGPCSAINDIHPTALEII